MVHLLHGYPGRRAEEEEVFERVGQVQREIVSGLFFFFFPFVYCPHFPFWKHRILFWYILGIAFPPARTMHL